MKIYIKPCIRFNQVRSCDLIATSDPQIIDDPGADPESPALAPERGKDWENWWFFKDTFSSFVFKVSLLGDSITMFHAYAIWV